MADRDVRMARSSGNCSRAEKDGWASVDEYTTARQAEWERGCFWAGVAVALTFGPMLALGAWFGWL